MAQFSGLPNDIVIDIWQYILAPRDMASLALVPKRTHELGFVSIRQHWALRQRSSKFDNDCDGCRLNADSTHTNKMTHTNDLFTLPLSECLTIILANPSIGFHIRELSVKYWRACHTRTAQRADHDPFPEGCCVVFEKAVSSFIRPEKTSKWIRALRKGYETPIVGLLLIVCPDIRLLRATECSVALFEIVRDVLTDSKAGSTALRCLHQVDLWCTDGQLYCFDPSAIVAMMPSLKIVNILDQTIIIPEPDVKSPLLNPSQIRDLSLVECKMSQDDLKILLRSLNNLKAFRIEAAQGDWFELATVCDVLFDGSENSLEVLHFLTAAESFSHPQDGAFRGNIASLCQFKMLNHLELSADVCIHCGPSTATIMSDLPPSVEKVIVHGRDWFANEALDRLPIFISATVEEKTKRFTNLSALQVYIDGFEYNQQFFEIKNCWDRCRDAAITFEMSSQISNIPDMLVTTFTMFKSHEI